MFLLTAALALLLPAQAGAAKPASPHDAIASFVGEEVAAVLHVNLSKLDVMRDMKALLGDQFQDVGQDQAIAGIDKNVETLRKAGVTHAYMLIDPLEIPGIPVFVMPGVEDAAAIRGWVAEAFPPLMDPKPSVETIRGAIVLGMPETLARLKTPTNPRPGLADAFAATGDAPVSGILLPSDVQRRALEEAMPELPRELGGGPIGVVTDGLKWAAFAVWVQPELNMKAIIQATNASSAKAMHTMAIKGIDLLGQQLAAAPSDLPRRVELTASLNAMKPEVKGDQLVIDLDAAKALRVVSEPIRAAREAARRAQCVNNLKQIGLAMHNYHDSYNGFPAAYSQSKDGKPLLSWRVHVLPYLDQQALYEQFHLDEPWDSEHNKTLIDKMPKVYICPNSGGYGEHKTTYLTPRGPHTIFPGADGTKLQEITDGTSNTIMVVEANEENAVVWTRPDDWEIGDMPTVDALKGLHPQGFPAAFGDGSVRFLKNTIDLDVLRALLTRDGGEVVSADEFMGGQ